MMKSFQRFPANISTISSITTLDSFPRIGYRIIEKVVFIMNNSDVHVPFQHVPSKRSPIL